MESKPLQLSFLLLIIAFLLFVAARVPLNKHYVFIDNKNQEIAAHLPVKTRDFQIEYTHSIHLSEVIESYEVLPDNSLRMVELEYEDFNIGMPSNAGEGENFVEKDGKYFITGMKKELPDFRIFIGNIDAGLFFKNNGRKYDLKKTLTRGESYTFKVQRLSLIQQLRGVNIDEQ
ncbi:DUF1850 domain-containing protein [Planococcus liqunii]|uniref:DUF1850 domain-containing protein n=1 Tax=Planococcus liqunii TaxID=3058394 RepID=A0ABT8MN10_9BACL|nr:MULTISPECIES: DUF1850 domain-containing protein [unclassified Planococcus (in: firmicutes)]MDN7226150.1 DUF1850 domain-containing protein [Planococcus sp. N064]WKA49934.1 DUF1850 domain-containing protein [Planococcus sp. N056]